MNTELMPPEHDEPEHEAGSVMAFWDHVEELRWVLIKSLVAFFLSFCLVLAGAVWFSDVLQWPLVQAYEMMGQSGQDIQLRTDGPNNVFAFLIQLGFFGSIALALPFMLYFMIQFVAPGLTSKEKRILRPVFLSIIGLFFAGLLTAFFLLVPFYLYMSLKFEAMFHFASFWTPVKYYGIVVWTSLGLGLLFQSPLVIILLIYLDIVSAEQLRKSRRYAMFIILVIAALLTPGGDPFTLAITAGPLYALYESAVFIGSLLRKKKVAAEEIEWEDDIR
ncbi:twin-arginine translocase subunit TatC [Cerasicoccus arenae]|uniref:Sec-independent protein translocase protein TatC n=1 Tax=Cerasicoccus arenae TaxID=424488 RepID=A0A8J3GFF4_9BACT|nr:twin-arginine translocase subunit TatC [Cerasicoccus arenae]MBK1857575.1 twin-arginine translocase subunit TatC [Cerasicoccus arenae]GHC05819.1 sec-independent protein translocase protein TatC [Cerasicoccus arenae]